jgi:hypothetical protein
MLKRFSGTKKKRFVLPDLKKIYSCSVLVSKTDIEAAPLFLFFLICFDNSLKNISINYSAIRIHNYCIDYLYKDVAYSHPWPAWATTFWHPEPPVFTRQSE